jgi:hypothetical protein
MKNHTKILLFVFVLFLAIVIVPSCSSESSKENVLASKIQYDVPISNNDPQLDWWINNMEGSKREPFQKRMLEAAGKGEVKVFDYFNNPLTPAQVKSIGSDTVYQTLLRSYPPYEEYDTMIVNSISYRDIVKVRFMEEWKWDPVSLQVEKKVLAIGPVMQKEIAGETFTQLLFWIAVDKGFPAQ